MLREHEYSPDAGGALEIEPETPEQIVEDAATTISKKYARTHKAVLDLIGITFNDLKQIALDVGHSAIKIYDIEKNNSLRAFVSGKMNYAIKEHLRVNDFIKRVDRNKIKKIEEAQMDFIRLHKRNPTREELSAIVSFRRKNTFNELWALKNKITVSFNALKSFDIPGIETEDMENVLHRKRINQILYKALEKLDSDEKLVVSHFLETSNIAEIGRKVGHSAHEVKVVLNDALNKIRIEFAKNKIRSHKELYTD
jgi:RNA polymerase sigma factor (sigma-70 family)